MGSRGSALALWQAEHIIARLRSLWPERAFTVQIIKTQGDRVVDVPLAQIGSSGVFVKEIENALLAGDIDLAVHSLKDMPSKTAPQFALAAVAEREDARDVLVSRDNLTLAQLPRGARIGTSSPRRSSQILAYRPDLQLVDLRGNVNTRLRKAKGEGYNGALLAAAGLIRMGWTDQIAEYIPFEISLPAVGQGALAVETRIDDDVTKALVAPLNHADTLAAVTAERAFMSAMGGGCQAPVGALGQVVGGELFLQGVVAGLDGQRVIREKVSGPVDQADTLGRKLAEIVLTLGAADILGG